MRGQLTEQLPKDGTAEEYLKEIEEKKIEIESSGVLKGRKKKKVLPLLNVNSPFEIPSSWKWIRLNTVVEIFGRIGFRGYTKNDIVDRGKGAISLSPSNITKSGKITYENCTFLSWDKYNESPEIMVEEDDVILVKTGSSYGKCAIVKSLPEKATINPQLAILKYVLCDRNYLHTVLISDMAHKQYDEFVIGAATPTFSQENLANFLLPLSPLAEQKRIVEKIEQVFSILDTIDELQAQYADNLTALKSKLIDAAIQGKLTEQLPEDGTAEELYQQIQEEKQKLIKEGKIKKQKPHPEISGEEIPFDIPENWKWVRLSHITYSIFAGKDKPKDFVTLKDKKHPIPVVANAVTNDGIIGYTSIATANAGTLTVAGRGTIGFTCYRDYDYCPIVRLLVIDVADHIYPQYIKFVFQRLTVDSVGSSIPQLTVPMIRPKLIPLPPLAEQKRIVQKLDEILPLCERIN